MIAIDTRRLLFFINFRSADWRRVLLCVFYYKRFKFCGMNRGFTYENSRPAAGPIFVQISSNTWTLTNVTAFKIWIPLLC